MNPLQCLPLKEVMQHLNCKDQRTAKRWCYHNNVGILSDIGSKRKYVTNAEFEIAKMQEPFKYLKNKYGNNFMEVLKAKMNFYVEYKTAIEEKAKRQQQNHGEDSHTPQGFHEKRFLDELKNL